MYKRILLPLVVAVLASATLPAQSAGRVDVNRITADVGAALDTVPAVDSSGTFDLERVARPHTYRPGREDKALQEVSRADTRKDTAGHAAAGQALRSTPRIMTGYAVGAIPMSSDVTASGARVYSIPIATAAGWNFVPSLSLQYSSQSGAGEAGAGWTVGGLGAVTQRARNTYYDPVTGRFLGPDPVMPEAGLIQTYNSYTYCLNNPLKYTDPDGEFWNYVIGAAIGGTANLIANWGNCDGFWEYAAAFGIGTATGAVSAATAGVGTGALLTLGACSGASTAAVNNIISQTDHFKGDISWNSFWNETLIGTVSGALGSHFGSLASQYAASIGGISISNPMWAGLVNGAEMGAMSGAATGAVMSLITGEDFWRSTFSGALSGGIVGGVSGFANGLVDLKKAKVAEDLKIPTAVEVGLKQEEVQRIKEEKVYSFQYDGKPYMNERQQLPSNTTYMEYVVPRSGGKSAAGTHRIIVGANGKWYYTPDHHIHFIEFRP